MEAIDTTTSSEPQANPRPGEGGRSFIVNVIASLVATLIAAAASFFAGELDRIGQALALLAVWTIPFVVGILVGWWTTRSRGLVATVVAVVLSAASFGAFFVAMPASDVVFEAAAPQPSTEESADVPSSASAGRAAPVSLDDAVDSEDCTWSRWDESAPQFDKRSVTPAGIACLIDESSAEGHLDFVVPADATSLRALVGVDSRSENATAAVNFAVLDVAGNVLTERRARYGEPADIAVNVANHERVRLRVRVADYVTDPADRSLTAAWGDLRFES